MGSTANFAIALAYFLIPLSLLPLLRDARRTVWLNLLLAIAFVFSCGIGHLLESLGISSMFWHPVTAVVSWLTVLVLLGSHRRLSYLASTFELLEATWSRGIDGKMLLQREGGDLRLIKLNPAAKAITQDRLQAGDCLCEKAPEHMQAVFPYNDSLINLYLKVLDTGLGRQLEFSLGEQERRSYITTATPLSKQLLYLTFHDVTQAKHDTLTQLYNRRMLTDQSQEWQSCIYIDLDRFKLINDRRGHHLGDRILRQVSEIILEQAHRWNGIGIRDGGDEFLLLLPVSDSYPLALALLRSIQAINLEGSSISASIGVASHPITSFCQSNAVERLKQAAETAAREAKLDRRSEDPEHRIYHWNATLAQRKIRQSEIETALRQALTTMTEFSLVYQPICHLETGQIVGAEALIRWHSSVLGPVSPAEFVPLAETAGLIDRLSDWVLEQTLQRLECWMELVPNLTISINLSPVELEETASLERILQRLTATTVPKHLIGFEVTERGIYNDLDRYKHNLQCLKNAGVQLKVDDFGTGQSGLVQLLQFCFDEVKVDRAFMPAGTDDMQQRSICSAIAAMAMEMQFDLVAEGIEQAFQRDLLLDMGYVYGQGYFFARPLSGDRFTELLKQGQILPLPEST